MQLLLSLSALDDPAAEEASIALLHEGGPAVAADQRCRAQRPSRRARSISWAALLKRPRLGPRHSGPRRARCFAGLAQCVMAEHRTANVKRLLDLAAAEPAGSWRQLAMLQGRHARRRGAEEGPAAASGEDALPRRPPESLATLAASDQKDVQDLAAKLDARLAWPGKPGVPAPPVIMPAHAPQQARFDKGKVIFTQHLCRLPSANGPWAGRPRPAAGRFRMGARPAAPPGRGSSSTG